MRHRSPRIKDKQVTHRVFSTRRPKQKLTIEEQINYMRDKSGIKFNIINEEDARVFLGNNTYYFKLKSYAKNYDKHIIGEKNGKYINLEFSYLVELSNIDMYFRRIIMKMTLDIEHFLKTQLMKDFQANDREDGYSIVEDFYTSNPNIKRNITIMGTNSASTDLVKKFERRPFAIWNIIEVLGFSDFTKLYRLYYNKYPNRNSMQNCLWSVRILRNAAAHNSCLLNSLKIPYNYNSSANSIVNQYISRIKGIGRVSRNNKMQNPIMHDFVVTLYVFNHIITSTIIKKDTMDELRELMDNTITKNKIYFKKNTMLKSHYEFAKKIIDYFYELCV